MIRKITLLWFFSFFTVAIYATHNRAGEITYEQIGELTIQITVTTYSKTSAPGDTDTIFIHWGDGTISKAGRTNGMGTFLPDDLQINYYKATHTYPGRATYNISFTDPNRTANIVNMGPPNSVRIPLHLKTSFSFLNAQFQGENSSVKLLQPPVDFACVGQRFVHNPNAFDPEGDSLAYELVVPFSGIDTEVPNYFFPDQISPGLNNNLSLDSHTGTLIWDAPQRAGEYNVTIKIYEYRNGVLLNVVIRDMQILVRECENRPPVIQAPDNLCVVAGTPIRFPVFASDPDMPLQPLRITALGGPFESPYSTATFSAPQGYVDQPITAEFSWTPSCNDISNQPYTVVFKTEDNFFTEKGLADLKTLTIKVVGPPPEDVKVESEPTSNTISWELPYACDVTQDEYFQGFTVWRSAQSNPFVIDTCTPGLEGRGYIPIAFKVTSTSNGRYHFVDREVNPNDVFCYRITASFALTSQAGNPFNIVESLPSNEACSELAIVKPYITKVSVLNTDTEFGQIEVRWILPDPVDFDTTFFRGPYEIELERAIENAQPVFLPVPGGQFQSSTFSGLLSDTSFVDDNLNTKELQFTYRIIFKYNNGSVLAGETKASSVFLNIAPMDEAARLSWTAMVPWQNYLTRVFRKSGENFILIGTSESSQYIDRNLINGEEYCYRIETEGSYGFARLPSPLINDSQENCVVPEDLQPPCIPALKVTNFCDENAGAPTLVPNNLSWTFSEACDKNDIAAIRIYSNSDKDFEFKFLIQVDGTKNTFDHRIEEAIGYCYYITSVDSLGNESDSSQIMCAEKCLFYSLPNTFTPNGDGANDLFKPYPYQFVERVLFTVFNRWGQKVFETEDPNINWDGTNFQNKLLAEGVYYYTCEVYESDSDKRLEADKVLSGYIELIR